MWNQLRISTRLFLLIGLLAALLAGVGAIALVGLEAGRASLHAVHADNLVPMSHVAEIQQRLLRNRLAIAVALITPDAATIGARTAEVQQHVAAIDAAWKAYGARELGADERRLADEFARARSRFVAEGLQPTVAALRGGDIREANRLVVEAIRPLYEPVDAGIRALVQRQLAAAEREYEAAVARNRTILATSIAAIVLGLLIAVGVGWLLVRDIAGALAQSVHAADAVAAGNLQIAIEPTGRHEITRLMDALLRMRDKLAHAVGHVRDSAEGVASASSQIAQGNLDLSARTEQQAASLEETAASMEQLTATVRQNADSARLADQLARGACGVVGEAGQAVERVVQTMRGIDDNARRIGEIIGLIDGIALQTNILALNAAVEAARAGEAGRGFAVVATEVRALAQRSADAAKEIKQLVGNSMDTVGAGSKLVNEAGATMQQIVHAVKQVTDLIAEISAASGEQSSGIEKVNHTVGQLDEMTQQNAALVEEAMASASSLEEQARDLVDSAAAFKLPG